MTPTVKPQAIAIWRNRALLALTSLFVLTPSAARISNAAPATVNAHRCLVWGDNQYAELGDGTHTSRILAVDIAGKGALAGKTVTALAGSVYNGMALCSDGTVGAWGDNSFGQLGNGTSTSSYLPTSITGLGALRGKTVRQLAMGQQHVLALCADGTLVSWGDNRGGQLGDGTYVAHSLPINITGKGVLKGKKVTQIASGTAHSFALCSDGTVAAWGNNDKGQLGTGGSGSTLLLPFDITNKGALAGKTVTQIATGFDHTLALCSDGTVATWGYNGYGQLGDGSTMDHPLPLAITENGALKGKTVTRVFVRAYQSMALCSDGTLAGWGYNHNGQLGDGTTAMHSLPFATGSLGALKGKTVIQVALADTHGLALCSDGTMVSWGGNVAGQLGDGTTVDHLTPVDITQLGGLKGTVVTAIAAGAAQSLAVATAIPSAPTISIITPTDQQTLPQSSFDGNTISGKASDDVGVARVEVKLYRTRAGVNQIWNGTAFTTIPRTVAADTSGTEPKITWNLFSKAPPQSQLDQGEYQVIVYASDADGNTTSVRTTFTLSAPTPDTEKPVVTIRTPTAKQALLTSSINSNSFTGTASDNRGPVRADLKLYRTRGGVNQIWNGTAFTVTSTTIPATLTGSNTSVDWSMGSKTPPQNVLDAGEYQLIAYATDAAGNTSSARITFILAVSGSGT